MERNKKYAIGDIAYTTQLPAGYYLECVTAGTTGNAEPTISVESENVNDGTVKWGVKSIQDASKLGLPVGFEAFTTNPNLQAGWLPLLGGEYSRTTYADLWAWVQTQNGYLVEESAWQAKAAANGGNVPFYSKGDGSTTFRVPALKCWVRGAGSISEVGGYLAAGLPNITGTLLGSGSNSINNETSFTGAFAYTNAVLSKTYGASEKNEKYNSSADFKASLSNSIYGSSDTVQPPSIIGLWCVKAYGTVTNVGSTDISNISTGLTQAETRISALENHGAGATVVESYRNGTEWYRVWSDGWVEQGGHVLAGTSSSVITVNFLKPFADTDYVMYEGVQSTDSTTSTTYRGVGVRCENTTDVHSKTGFKMLKHPYASKYWYACGQGA